MIIALTDSSAEVYKQAFQILSFLNYGSFPLLQKLHKASIFSATSLTNLKDKYKDTTALKLNFFILFYSIVKVFSFHFYDFFLLLQL